MLVDKTNTNWEKEAISKRLQRQGKTEIWLNDQIFLDT